MYHLTAYLGHSMGQMVEFVTSDHHYYHKQSNFCSTISPNPFFKNILRGKLYLLLIIFLVIGHTIEQGGHLTI